MILKLGIKAGPWPPYPLAHSHAFGRRSQWWQRPFARPPAARIAGAFQLAKKVFFQIAYVAKMRAINAWLAGHVAIVL